jgi:hypothetical protein
VKPFPRTAIAFSLAAAFTVAGTQHAEAQESDWQIDFGASVQLTTISGDIGFTGVDNARTLSLGDLVSNVQPGFAIEFDVWKGDWGLLADMFTVEYEGKAATDQNAVFTTQAEESVGRLALGRQVADGAHVYAGARFWSTALDFRLTEPNPGNLDGSDNWVDPVIGGSIDTPIDDGWFAVLDADVGGFGLSSNLTWHAMGSIGYEVSPGWSVLVRYRATGVDYETDSSAGGGTVTYDTIRHGAFFGLVLHF